MLCVSRSDVINFDRWVNKPPPDDRTLRFRPEEKPGNYSTAIIWPGQRSANGADAFLVTTLLKECPPLSGKTGQLLSGKCGKLFINLAAQVELFLKMPINLSNSRRPAGRMDRMMTALAHRSGGRSPASICFCWAAANLPASLNATTRRVAVLGAA